ncbi:MAG: hypothetical protein FDW93_06875 [Bergeyella sp.]|nr:hypothetical protein [Bergeyella sp.]
MLKKNSSLPFITGSGVLFLLLAFAYCYPVLQGKKLFQHDIVQYKGGARELLDYREKNGKETYWTNSMFSGMPTYQMGAQFRGDLIKKIDNILLSLPKPVNYFFLLYAGFFLLGMIVVKNWKLALLGATFFGLSTYFYIIIAVGHNGKVHTISYFAPVLSGIFLIYFRKSYLWGFILTSLFIGLQISANHPQMTYYLFIAVGVLIFSEALRMFFKKTSARHFFLSTGIFISSCVLGAGMNSQRIMANADYVKETVRGGKILSGKDTDNHNSQTSGMDKKNLLMWSYGKLETLNLFIPHLMGGGSQEKESENISEGLQKVLDENISTEEQYDHAIRKISENVSSLTYWGDQPMTSGPAYQGAVVIFLAIMGFFLIAKRHRYWMLFSAVLVIGLAWGNHFLPLSDFFINYIPLYNKFRAPSSILVVIELLFPLVAIMGLHRFFYSGENEHSVRSHKIILLGCSIGITGITFLLLIFGRSLLAFSTEPENAYLPTYILDYLKNERYHLFRKDAIKAIFYVVSVFLILFMFLNKIVTKNTAILTVGLLSLFDLWGVNRRYLNSDNFVDKIFAEEPFQTESSEYLLTKATENPALQSIVSAIPVNKTLQMLSEKDPSYYRIFNQTLGTFNETNTSHFSSSIGGYHAVKLRRYDDLINTYFYTSNNIKQMQIPEVLNMLNTKYIIGGPYFEPKVQINPLANGNAWFVSRVNFVSSPDEELESIGKTVTKRMAVVAEEDKKYFINKPLAADTTATITLKKYSADELEYNSESLTSQLAVFSEIYYSKGWKLFIDDVEVPYIKANYLLRAVYVPKGKHRIRMFFNPEVIQKGKIFSLLAFGLFIILSTGGIFYLHFYRRRTH